MIGLEDVERLLGKRPFSSQEMRNIDKYRHGPTGKPPPPTPPSEVESKEVGSEGGPGKGGDGGSGEEPSFHGRLEPGAVVAT